MFLLRLVYHMSMISPLVEELEAGCDLDWPGQFAIMLTYHLPEVCRCTD